MITRQEFPYLQELVINDAYAVKNLRVPLFEPGQEFKHLVLTGRNGSGKTTVLRALVSIIRHDAANGQVAKVKVRQLKQAVVNGQNPEYNLIWQSEIDKLNKVEPHFTSRNNKEYNGFAIIDKQVILAFFEATRKVYVKDVTTIAREDTLEAQLLQPEPNQSPAEFFKQYLVNKKVFQVFDTMEGKSEGAKQQELFFTKLEETLAKIFEDPGTKLEFVRESFEFYINLSDGRRFTFNQLSAGFSAFLSILTELLMRVDLLRKQANNYSYDPCGFVLIDEPETHLHLEMQYQILPLLTNLFPNLQFIVATHSPAVASSIKNATVFDLSTGQAMGDQAAGSSFSELMQTHFGLENEYSNVADKILEEVTEIGQMADRAAALARMQKLLAEQGRYMSPVLRLDVQAQLLHLQREQAA
ncbi:AAA family ATPase [Hymenobacter monticola]|uniref:AAA family ATPase n=1 Tax=Hymenobacter monticola TaxID=1705399 RepID=A0ABY4B793_9BACT|nr:AAA family ATPase [Hymenobacter monticola]UOE35046.1 AAA family ATPase [Hymenobacter monticola]